MYLTEQTAGSAFLNFVIFLLRYSVMEGIQYIEYIEYIKDVLLLVAKLLKGSVLLRGDIGSFSM